jgi:nickel-dependent lactate racemase
VRVCRDVWEIEVSQKLDITIVSPGGHPKDFDMHQAQKALASAELITRPGGSIVLVAECPDGVGKFGQLLMDSRDPLEVIEGFRDKGFDSKNHSSKAFMYARCLLKHNVYFITDQINPADLKHMFFYPSATIENAYANAKMKCEGDPSTAILPYAVDCILKIT